MQWPVSFIIYSVAPCFSTGLNNISADAVMFLMNALYFKGIWYEQFKPENTINSPFTLEDETTINIPTMHGLIPAKVFFSESYRTIELFYGRKNFSMIILVPDLRLTEFLADTNPELWHEITTEMDNQTSLHEIDVALPKFSFEYEKCLNDQLMALGMIDVFDGMFADFSKITDANIFVDFVKQNTFVEINEEGTEAAAVTTIGFELTSVGDAFEFFVNKPFIFAIREQTTNTLLFMRKVVEP